MLVKEKYDYVLFMESFPCIPRTLMKTFVDYSKTITKVRLYFFTDSFSS